ncbi:hypothetical protein BC830DRAFT_1173793 [Chytriomyces sp. MP71]|nr:hypothetical protein BC830DRAFT_1173793 [Chytriomyces sp. MP71]
MSEHVKQKKNETVNGNCDLQRDGHLFQLETKFVLSHDWLLAKMLTTDVPCNQVDGTIYLGTVNPTSFQIILSVFQDLLDVSGLGGEKLTLLISTIRFLVCDKVAEKLESIASEHAKQLQDQVQHAKDVKCEEKEGEEVEVLTKSLSKLCIARAIGCIITITSVHRMLWLSDTGK